RYDSKSSIFKKICPDTGVNCRFSRKIVQIRGTMNEKRKKEAFVGVRRIKIGENRLSPVRENQKTIKIGFPSRGKIRKSAKNVFPNIGKLKIQQKSTFPTLGRLENSENQLSQT
ncbi:MAG: hypothetical protein ACFNNK_10200, partial [Segatella oris]